MKNQVNFAESLKGNKAHTATGTEVSPATASRCRAGLLPTIGTYRQERRPGHRRGGRPCPNPICISKKLQTYRNVDFNTQIP